MAVDLQPPIGIVRLLWIIRAVGLLWIWHEVAMHDRLVLLAAVIAEITGFDLDGNFVVEMGPDRMKFLTAVAAEVQAIKQCLAIGVGLILLRFEGEIAITRWLQGGVHVTTG